MKKSKTAKIIALLLACLMVVSCFAACNKDSEEEKGSDYAGADTLVVGYSNFSEKFSPFFADSGYDQDVADMTQVLLLDADREGNVIKKGIEGETIAYNGTDYTYTGIADCDVVENSDGTVDYNITMRDDIVFSDGTPMTIDDAIFSLYVLSDPTYDGGGTISTLPIVGMEEYRSGMSSLTDIMLQVDQAAYDAGIALGEAILAGKVDDSVLDELEGMTDEDLIELVTDLVDEDTLNGLGLSEYVTDEQAAAFDAAFDEAGINFAQDIIDYCLENYADYGAVDDVTAAELWGYELPEGGTAADLWDQILANYGYDISDEGINLEVANTSFADFLMEALGDDASEFASGIQTGESAANIAGVKKTGDYSMTISLSQVDAAAIYQLQYQVAPMHYYGNADLYDYDNNQFGFKKGDLSSVKDKTTVPMGAGAYKFVSYENGIVTFEKNDLYYKGAPKIKNVIFKESTDADKLTGVATGTLDIADPSISESVVTSIKEYNNGELTGDVITTNTVDNLGYGYMGICSKTVNVGGDPGSEESKNLRKAFATLFAVYRDTAVNSYYGERAAVIQYPISNTSWAAPRPADEGYEIAYSKDVDGNPIYTEGMTEQEKYDAALQAAIGYFKAAGYKWDEASGKFTAAPAGAELAYEFMIPGDGVGDHPVFGVVTAASTALADIGIDLQINDLANSSTLWDALDANSCDMWAAAWQATADPDMYQIYHSSSVVGAGGSESNHYCIMDEELDELIVAARESLDQSYRKATYKQCLDIVLDWGCEIPAYQRQNAIVFSTERIKMDTVTPDITTFWDWMHDLESLEMN